MAGPGHLGHCAPHAHRRAARRGSPPADDGLWRFEQRLTGRIPSADPVHPGRDGTGTTTSTTPSGTLATSRTAAAVRTPAAVRTLAATPRRTAAAGSSPIAAPKASPQASPRPSPRPSPKPSPKASTSPDVFTTHNLEMTTGYRFSPSSLTIAVGDAIRTHNGDTMDHTFTGPSWDTGNMEPGAVKTLRFRTAGTFDFYCSPHKDLGMTGTLTVH